MIGDLFKYWTYQVFSPGTVLREKYDAFKSLLEQDQRAHEGMAELQRISYEGLPVDANRIYTGYDQFSHAVGRIVDLLAQMCPGCYSDLKNYHTKFDHYIRFLLASSPSVYEPSLPNILMLTDASRKHIDITGGKAGGLITAMGHLGLPVPQGFIITTNAFNYLIEYNNLRETIDQALARIHPDNPGALVAVSNELTGAMRQIEFPPDLKTGIEKALDDLTATTTNRLQLAVRSSAVAEDSQTTFAGQYRSCLGVPAEDLLPAYLRVLTSKFEPAALYYRIRSGLEDRHTPMAVMVMEMIEPQFSGVLYSRGPTADRADKISIYYVDGLGDDLVGGLRQARVVTMARSRVEAHLPPSADGKQRPDADSPRLNSDAVSILGQWAIQLEKLLQTPCDVEWCQDRSGRLKLLQCRPLRQQPKPRRPKSGRRQLTDDPAARLLYQGGSCACSGTGCGPVYRVGSRADLADAPDNCVAVLTNAPPHYVPLLDRVSAVIIEQGSVAGHFQAVAREFNIPTLVGAEHAGSTLKQGQRVTLVADTGKVFAGCAAGAQVQKQDQKNRWSDNPLLRKLEAAMSFITPLELIDPQAATFTPQSCRSMHDIIRFAHEKAIYEMFHIGDRRLKRKKGARRLLGKLPMVIYVLDVGKGIDPSQAHKGTIHIEDVRCEPMLSLWNGLLHPEIQWAGHTHFDWDQYDRLVMNGGIISPEDALLSSYAVVADRYLNFCLKFGYHFAIIDALFQQPPKSGHIWFRFTGGGGDYRGRQLRVRFIQQILSALGFDVQTKGELVNARRDAADESALAQGLVRIGHLLGVTRLMDLHLKDAQSVDDLVSAFMDHRFADFNWEAESDLP